MTPEEAVRAAKEISEIVVSEGLSIVEQHCLANLFVNAFRDATGLEPTPEQARGMEDTLRG